MLFNSFEYLIFLPTVLFLYFLLPYNRRWILLLVASYYFYMSWNPIFILLILASTLVDYFASLLMSKQRNKKKRRKYLYFSLFTNLGLLFIFKYFNFFNETAQAIADFIGWNYPVELIEVLLPVGISFYTFQTLSYTIDVYNNKIKPERHLGIFALYVAYFPQLVAGPIERPDRLIPQLKKKVHFDFNRIRSGLLLILWGLFKKVVIADRAAVIVNNIYSNPQDFDGLSLIIGTVAFAFQIYGDFSGYSDIAIGSARMFGHDLMLNFDRPYFSKSISEFWKRWHISLSTWFRDYLYIPLGGNRVIKWRWYYNLFITFLISGLWHGAAWTFVIWGGLHGIYLVTSIITTSWRASIKKWLRVADLGWPNKIWQVIFVFTLVNIGWVFFRANSLGDAVFIIGNFGTNLIRDIRQTNTFSDLADFATVESLDFFILLCSIFIMESIHLMQRQRGYVSKKIMNTPLALRWGVYYLAILIIIFFGVFNGNEFIYFQF